MRIVWNKGKKLSKEHREKLSISHTGKKMSLQTRKKMSDKRKKYLKTYPIWNKGLKGITGGWNKGIKTPLIVRQKISNSLKGRIAWNKGLTKENNLSVRKISILTKGKLAWNKGLKGYNKGHCISEITKEKIGAKNKIKMKTLWQKPEYRKKMSEIHKGLHMGERNGFWKGGKSFEPYTLLFNQQLKEKIRVRDNFKCQLCGVPEMECKRRLSIHHIDYDKKNTDLSNLVSLCDNCHQKTNHDREYWIRVFQKQKEFI